MKKIIFILILSFFSCSPYIVSTDTDDLYYNNRVRPLYPNYRYSPFFYDNWYPFNDFYGFGFRYPNYYRSPQTIIIVPKSDDNKNYGKRPDRETVKPSVPRPLNPGPIQRQPLRGKSN